MRGSREKAWRSARCQLARSLEGFMLSQSGELTPRHCKAVAAWIGFALGMLEIGTGIGGSLGILRCFEISGALSAKRGKLRHKQHVKPRYRGSLEIRGARIPHVSLKVTFTRFMFSSSCLPPRVFLQFTAVRVKSIDALAGQPSHSLKRWSRCSNAGHRYQFNSCQCNTGMV